MSTHPHAALRRILLDRRAGLLRLEQSNEAQERELRGTIEPDWEDAAAVATATSVLARLEHAERREVQRIDAALERMRLGTYGRCESCGDPLPARRLLIAPEATCCVACETVLEARR
jgi:RNA polymerase-binding protein DksA